MSNECITGPPNGIAGNQKNGASAAPVHAPVRQRVLENAAAPPAALSQSVTHHTSESGARQLTAMIGQPRQRGGVRSLGGTRTPMSNVPVQRARERP
jgi:hypothetical protein